MKIRDSPHYRIIPKSFGLDSRPSWAFAISNVRDWIQKFVGNCFMWVRTDLDVFSVLNLGSLAAKWRSRIKVEKVHYLSFFVERIKGNLLCHT